MTAVVRPAHDFFSLSKTYRGAMAERVRRRRALLVEMLSYPEYRFREYLSDVRVREMNRQLGVEVTTQTYVTDQRAFCLAATYLQGRRDCEEYRRAQDCLATDAWLTRPLRWLIDEGFTDWNKVEAAIHPPTQPPAPVEESGYFLSEESWNELTSTGAPSELADRIGKARLSLDQLRDEFDALDEDLRNLKWDLDHWGESAKRRAIRVKVRRSGSNGEQPSVPQRHPKNEPTPVPVVRMRLQIPDICHFYSTGFELSQEVEQFDFTRLDVTELTFVTRMLESLSRGGPRHPNLLSRKIDLGVRTRKGAQHAELWITEFGIVRALWRLNGNLKVQRVWKKSTPDLADYDRAFDRAAPTTLSS